MKPQLSYSIFHTSMRVIFVGTKFRKQANNVVMASVNGFQKMKCTLHAIRIAHAHSNLLIEADVVDGTKISEAVSTSMHVFERDKHPVNNLVDI